MPACRIRRRAILLGVLPCVLLCALLNLAQAATEEFSLGDRHGVAAVLAEDHTTMGLAAGMLQRDLEAVGGVASQRLTRLDQCQRVCIVIGRHDSALLREVALQEGLDFSALIGQWERYVRVAVESRRHPGARLLVIAGSDPRGAVFGAVDLSRELGVSAWEWWADVKPAARDTLAVKAGRILSDGPSVRYRGIFLNDEDWGLQPWAAKTFDPSGDIGPATYARIFELLWRLKANLVWPAMHDSTKPFYQMPGNARTANDYAILVGTSHAEPMMRNNVREWKKSDGAFNFFSNREALVKYWKQRVDQVHEYENMFSMGIRGVHDSAMEGATSIEQARQGVEDVIGIQRNLLADAHRRPLPQIPQALTVYKEVLDIYNSGLKVPDDITLIWPDDNYGYLHQLSTPKEAARAGGTGLYYHISYWGRPHDYLWLATTHPGLIRDQLQRAVATGTDRVWVLNVGDIKPAEYLTQYFLDVAFDKRLLERGAREHLQRWMAEQFGAAHAGAITDIMLDFYALAWERRPEFMGFSQTEPTTPTRQTDYLQSGGEEAERRIASHQALALRAQAAGAALPAALQDAYFELVLYPVRAAAGLNTRILKLDLAAQHARMGRPTAQLCARQAEAAQAVIVADAAQYNALAGGKWRGMMDIAPRRLPVFVAPLFPAYGASAATGAATGAGGDAGGGAANANATATADCTLARATTAPPSAASRDRLINLPATLAVAAAPVAGWEVVDFGSMGSALRSSLALPSRQPSDAASAPALEYRFTSRGAGAARVKLVAVPVHPLTSANQLRIAVAIDDQPLQILDYATQGRSDEWKRNVLSNAATRVLSLPALTPGQHRLRVHALDPGFILDRIEIAFDGAPVYYGAPPAVK